MGYVSLLLINHDAVGYIERNPKEFWDSAWHAINRSASIPQTFGVGGCYPTGQALFCDKQGSLRLMLIGQGSADTIAYDTTDAPPHNKEAQLQMLRRAAATLGYRLMKTPAPRPKKTPDQKEKRSGRKKS